MFAPLQRPGWIEQSYIVVSLLLVTQALSPLIADTSGTAGLTDSNPLSLFSALIIYAIAMLALLRRPQDAVKVIADNGLLIAVFTLPLFSVMWSGEPLVALRRAIALVMTGIFCVYIATRLSPEEFLRKLLIALFIGGVASLAYTIFFPGLAIEHGAVNKGSWNGVYGHKAILGRVTAVAVLVCIFVRPRFGWERVIRWMTIPLFLFLSLKSESRASWLMLIAGLGFMVILMAMRSARLSSGLKVSIAASLGAVLITGAALSYQTVLADFGRDMTFSGRTKLWEGAIAVAQANHPFLGAGYRTFWTETGAEGVRHYIQNWGGLPAHGHNGYLDVWLELGIPGLLLFSAFLILTGARLARRLLREPLEPSWAALSIFFFVFILNNLSVTVAFKYTDIAWIFAVLAALYARGAANAHVPVTPRASRHARAFAPAFPANRNARPA